MGVNDAARELHTNLAVADEIMNSRQATQPQCLTCDGSGHREKGCFEKLLCWQPRPECPVCNGTGNLTVDTDADLEAILPGTGNLRLSDLTDADLEAELAD